MINLRYHIVSITAVFLALGIGVTLGSSLIQRYTIDTLEGRLDELGERLDRTDGENRELRGELADRDTFDERLAEEGTALFQGHLEDVPVLIIANQGSDDDLITATRSSLRASGSVVSGTLLFTSRWDELTQGEIDELSEVIGRRLSNEQVTRTTLVRRIATELVNATAEPPAPPEPEPTPEPAENETPGLDEGTGDDPAPVDPTAEDPPGQVPTDDDQPDGEEFEPGAPSDIDDVVPPVPETEIIPALLDLGYLEFLPESAATPLPAFRLRIVVIDDESSGLEAERALVPLLDAITTLRSGPLPVVVVGSLVERRSDGDDSTSELGLSGLVATVRERERMREGLSTVDDATSFAGQAAVVLALSAVDVAGHYGVGEGAEALLPPGAT
jgi:hypothetical protein